MNASQVALRQAARLRCPARQQLLLSQRQWVRHASSSFQQPPPSGRGKFVGFATVFLAAAAGAYYYPSLKDRLSPEQLEDVESAKVELEFEQPRKASLSKEDHRDLLSSQHLQVKSSWEHPGVYAWGSNSGKVIDPDSKEKYIKAPQRITYFNDQLLRDLKLTQRFGAAITEKGDLVQWGLGFSSADPTPSITLKGKDLVKLEVSADRILGLSRSGSVYAIPSSRDDVEGGAKQNQKGASSFWSSSGKENISFRDLTPTSLAYGEKVTDISSGVEHCLMLTSKGRVFSAVSSIASFPAKGQMGIPGFSWETRPQGPYDQAHEISTLKGFDVSNIATGDYHSVILDKTGRIFTFGDNSFGQLGFPVEIGSPYVFAPSMLPIDKLYKKSGLIPKVTSIAAGGVNTFFTCQADAPLSHNDSNEVAPGKRVPRAIVDLWATGHGTNGQLGTGKWTHISGGPTKVKALSSLYEFDEKTNKLVPIKIKSLNIGTTHSAAVMGNVTQTSASNTSSENETNWGSDILFWGGNEHYQLGTGKRNNMNTPTYIGPLDGGEGDAAMGRKGEMHRLCLTPQQTARLGEGGKGRKVTLEQKVECGQLVTGVYSSVPV